MLPEIAADTKKAAPTKKHRVALWECMLGTVYAMNDEGHVKYFDKDHKAAIAFAGINNKRDIRVSKLKKENKIQHVEGPRVGQLTIFIKRNE